MQDLQIAIVGAGPGGLTLASLLETQKINYTVFDLRSRPPAIATAPSGSLDLHAESGLLALKTCGLIEKFYELKADCTEDMTIADKDGQVKHQDSGSGERPEISRSDLTSLLLSSIPAEKIHWEHKLLDVESTGQDGRWKLNFQDRVSSTFDLVVGADGAWSRVRPILTSTKPHYSGIQNITLTIPNLTKYHPSLAALVGKGTYMACGQCKAISSQRGSQDSTRIYLMLSTPEEKTLSSIPISTLENMLLTQPEYFQDWSPSLKSLITYGFQSSSEENGELKPVPLYMLPTDHKWVSNKGITLLGDAAHLMTPFAGEGVNAAMQDAMELCDCIVKNRSPDVEEYETAMLTRAQSNAEETFRNLQIIFTEDAPKDFVELMNSYGPP